MTEPPLNLERGFTVSVYFPPGSDPVWVSDFLSRVAEDAYSMPSETLDAFVVGHAADVLGIDRDTACPTPCDTDCDAPCHEAHQPRHKRDHEPETCPASLPELTREDALELVDDLGQQAYRAEDRLAFVREMCDQADRDGKAITTEQVRAWTMYTGCGGAIVLPEDVQERLQTAMQLHRLTGRIIDEAQRDRWTAAGRCGTCGFDGDRTGCQDCDGGSVSGSR